MKQCMLNLTDIKLAQEASDGNSTEKFQTHDSFWSSLFSWQHAASEKSMRCRTLCLHLQPRQAKHFISLLTVMQNSLSLCPHFDKVSSCFKLSKDATPWPS